MNEKKKIIKFFLIAFTGLIGLSILFVIKLPVREHREIKEKPVQLQIETDQINKQRSNNQPIDTLAVIDSILINMNSTREISRNYGEIAIYSFNGRKLRKINYPLESNWRDYDNYIRGYPTIDTISGDFDGEGKKERAWFKRREGVFDDCWSNQTKKSCSGIIVFSSEKIKPLIIDYCPMGCFINEGDLNGDKKDEIGVLPGWFSSACRLYHVFSYKGTAWRLICEPINSAINMREAGIDIIQKHPQDSSYVIIRESAMFIESKFPDIPFHNDRVGPFSCQESPAIEYKWKLKKI